MFDITFCYITQPVTTITTVTSTTITTINANNNWYYKRYYDNLINYILVYLG